MGAFSRLLKHFFRETKSGAGAAARSGATPLFVSGDSSAMSIATVYCCVRLLSESVANLPLNYLRRKDGILVMDSASGLNYLLNVQPSPTTNAFDFWRCVIQNVLLDGNAYIVPVYDTDTVEVSRLVLCNRGTVAHDTLTDTYAVSDAINGVSGVYAESDIIHIKGMPGYDRKRGVSVLTYASMATSIAATGDRETKNRFSNGGNVRGLVTNDSSIRGFGEYQDAELQKAAFDLDARFQGGQRIVGLPGQADFKQLSLSSTDMQFLESRKFTVREICRFFGVHPSFVFDDTSNNYKSAEQANAAFLSHTLNPMLRNIELELQRKLVPRGLAGMRKFEFDRRGLLACDLDGMMKHRTYLLQTGATVNELRRMDNRQDVPGGDVVLVSANLRSVSEVSAQAMADKKE